MAKVLSKEQQIYFRDSFRDARAVALKDAEGFDATFFALERFGKFLSETESNLGRYKHDISAKAAVSPLATQIPLAWPEFHTCFDDLYEQLGLLGIPLSTTVPSPGTSPHMPSCFL